MPPASKKDDGRTVEVEVRHLHVLYNDEAGSYTAGVAVGKSDSVAVVDFAETWQNESGIITVAVVRG
jgi:predicted protein tyrosine phosphatase